jgi:hypothetical protein
VKSLRATEAQRLREKKKREESESFGIGSYRGSGEKERVWSIDGIVG